MAKEARVVRDGDRFIVEIGRVGIDEDFAFGDVTADVQRLIDEATKELREWREAVMTENDRLNDENRSLRKQINIMGFAYDSLTRLYDSNRGDRPER
jgi:hypothetical protein